MRRRFTIYSLFFDIGNSIFWYQKMDFLISRNKEYFLISEIPTHVCPDFPTQVRQVFPSNWLLFPHRLIAQWWETNSACKNDFCETSENMLTELGFELTIPWLTARIADWKTYQKRKCIRFAVISFTYFVFFCLLNELFLGNFEVVRFDSCCP